MSMSVTGPQDDGQRQRLDSSLEGNAAADGVDAAGSAHARRVAALREKLAQYGGPGSRAGELAARFAAPPSPAAGPCNAAEGAAADRAGAMIEGYLPPYEADAQAGCYRIVDKERGVNIRIRVGEPAAVPGEQDVVAMTEFYRGCDMPKGSGTRMVLGLMARFGICLRPGGTFVHEGISNPETLAAFVSDMQRQGAAGIIEATSAMDTVHGRTGAAIVRGLGLEMGSMQWDMATEAGKISMRISTRARAPAGGRRLSPPSPPQG